MTSKHQFGGKKVRLGDVATYINGYAFKPSDYAEAGKPIIRIQDLTGNAYQTNRYSGELMDRYAVTKGDVLISWSASLGVFEWSGEDAWLNQHIFKVVFDKMPIERRYFIHHACYVIKISSSLAHGATMRHLTKKVFENLPFFYPNLSDQTRIAKRLDLIQKQISNLNILLKKLDSLIKSRFVEMFGDPISSLKYSRCLIGDLAVVSSGATPSRKKPEYYEGTIPWVKTGEVAAGNIDETEECITEAAIRDSACRILPAGTILIAMYGQGDTRGKSAILNIEAATNQACAALEFKDEIDARFALIFLQLCYDDLRNLSQGGNQKNLNLKIIKEYSMLTPPVYLQKEFANFVAQVDKLKFETQQSIEKLQMLYDSLAQEYFAPEGD